MVEGLKEVVQVHVCLFSYPKSRTINFFLYMPMNILICMLANRKKEIRPISMTLSVNDMFCFKVLSSSVIFCW